jgi:hypothetical protein
MRSYLCHGSQRGMVERLTPHAAALTPTDAASRYLLDVRIIDQDRLDCTGGCGVDALVGGPRHRSDLEGHRPRAKRRSTAPLLLRIVLVHCAMSGATHPVAARLLIGNQITNPRDRCQSP